MGLRKKILSISDSVNNLVMAGAKSKITGTVVGTAAKGLNKGFNAAAGIANKGLQAGKNVVKNLSNSETRDAIKRNIGENVGKVVNNTITDENAYNIIKNRKGEPLKIKGGNLLKSNRPETPIGVANKFLIGDDIHRRIKTGLDSAAHIVSGDSMLTLKQPLIKTGEDTLLPFGIKATGAGIAAASVVQFGLGVPNAGKQWTTNRMGTNQDSQPVTSAPITPAYAQNGGATGDLVFALRDLKGGFL